MNLKVRSPQSLATVFAILVAVASALLTGCGTTDSVPTTASAGAAGALGTETRLRNGDQLQVHMDTSANQPQAPIDTEIDENGEISLPLIGRIKAEGLTTSELAERIQANYVPRYYVRCAVTVLATVRFFYVGGEVRAPSRYNWSQDITLLKAINTAGGFTEYANRRKVEVARGGQKPMTFDCEDLRRHPNRDPAVRPGDLISVPRSVF
jgi:polysaccharide biosynthesis/export protein VpsN